MRILPLIPLIVLSFLLSSYSHAPTSQHVGLRKMSNRAFKTGEYLKYRIHYGIIDAGIAELRVGEVVKRRGRPVYHMIATGRSVGMAEWFFRTRDHYESFIDTQSIMPWEFIRDVDEGGYIIKRHLIFDHFNNTAKDLHLSDTKTYDIVPYAQDMLSCFYYARCLPTDNISPGFEIPVEMFLDHEDFAFKLRYLGSETVKTKFGRIRCKKFIPVVQSGRVFKDEEGLTLWVTDDANKVPVRLEAELAVGSIKMDLIDYENVQHPLKFH